MNRCQRVMKRQPKRQGATIVLILVMMVVLLAALAFTVDVGLMYVAQNQLQASADSSAMAAAWELVEQSRANNTNDATIETAVNNAASQYSQLNEVLQAGPALGATDFEIGRVADVENPVFQPTTTNFNAVRIRVRRTDDQNGAIPLFFGRFFGRDDNQQTATALAGLSRNIRGFRPPPDGSNLEILPFALDVQTWDDMMLNGGGTDDYAYNEATGALTSGSSDLKREVNLYPQGTGSPGNRGTVDIGSSNNSTADIARQILYGVSAADLAHHGGKLEFNSDHKMYLNGDTGISAGVKDELAAIIGQKRIIPLFTQVTGPGNNASYEITRLVGVRILHVKLTGPMSKKQLIIQPADVVSKGTIPNTTTTQTSENVFSPVWLMR